MDKQQLHDQLYDNIMEFDGPAAAQTAQRCIKMDYPHFQTSHQVDQTQPAGIVQMQANGDSLAKRQDGFQDPPDVIGPGHAGCVRQDKLVNPLIYQQRR